MTAPEQPTPTIADQIKAVKRLAVRPPGAISPVRDFYHEALEERDEAALRAAIVTLEAAQRGAEAVDADGWLRKLADHKRMPLNFRGRRLLACRAAETLHEVIAALGEDDGSELPPDGGLPAAPSEQQKQEMKNSAAVLLRMILIFNDGHVSPQKLGSFEPMADTATPPPGDAGERARTMSKSDEQQLAVIKEGVHTMAEPFHLHRYNDWTLLLRLLDEAHAEIAALQSERTAAASSRQVVPPDAREHARALLETFDGQHLNSQDISQDSAWSCLLDDIAEALTASASQARREAWQPIETAPKDGTTIIVPGGTACWRGNGPWFSHQGQRYIEWPVEAWMPFPEPPRALATPRRAHHEHPARTAFAADARPVTWGVVANGVFHGLVLGGQAMSAIDRVLALLREGHTGATNEQLARQADISTVMVNICLRKLEAAGTIEREPMGRGRKITVRP